MSEFMLERFREICPMKKINGMSREDLSHDVHIAFEIVGYQPNSLSDALEDAWESSEADDLSDFVYDV